MFSNRGFRFRQGVLIPREKQRFTFNKSTELKNVIKRQAVLPRLLETSWFFFVCMSSTKFFFFFFF